MLNPTQTKNDPLALNERKIAAFKKSSRRVRIEQKTQTVRFSNNPQNASLPPRQIAELKGIYRRAFSQGEYMAHVTYDPNKVYSWVITFSRIKSTALYVIIVDGPTRKRDNVIYESAC